MADYINGLVKLIKEFSERVTAYSYAIVSGSRSRFVFTIADEIMSNHVGIIIDRPTFGVLLDNQL